jgi:hypothetical protein
MFVKILLIFSALICREYQVILKTGPLSIFLYEFKENQLPFCFPEKRPSFEQSEFSGDQLMKTAIGHSRFIDLNRLGDASFLDIQSNFCHFY